MAEVWLGAGVTKRQADVKGRAGLRDLNSSRRRRDEKIVARADVCFTGAANALRHPAVRVADKIGDDVGVEQIARHSAIGSGAASSMDGKSSAKRKHHPPIAWRQSLREHPAPADRAP